MSEDAEKLADFRRRLAENPAGLEAGHRWPPNDAGRHMAQIMPRLVRLGEVSRRLLAQVATIRFELE